MADWIELTDFEIETLVGLLDREQRVPQPVQFALRLHTDLTPTAETGDLTASIDYAAVMSWVQTLAQQGRFRLIESLGLAIARLVLSSPEPVEGRAAIDAITITIRKPTILDGVAVPGVRLERTAAEVEGPVRALADGVTARTLVDTPTESAFKVVVEAEAAWEVPDRLALEVLAGHGTVGGRRVGRGDRIARGPARRLHSGDGPIVVLAVGSG